MSGTMKASQATLPPRLHLSLAALFGLLLSFSAMAAPPTVTLTSPPEGATWGDTPLIQVSADATDSDGTISKVEFYVDALLVGATSAPTAGSLISFLAYASPRPANGVHSLTARAYDNSGEITTSTARTLTVSTGLPQPSVTTSPVDPASNYALAALLSGTVNPNGGFVFARDVHFELGLTTSYGRMIASISNGFAGARPIPVYETALNLAPNTTYHYRLVANTSGGFFAGNDVAFTTKPNHPPTARDAFLNVPTADPVAVYGDEDDEDREPLTFSLVTGPSHGTVTVGSTVAGADFTYTPDSTFAGTDEFTYAVADEHGGTATATVHLTNYRKFGVGRYATTIMVDYGFGPRRAIGALGLDVTATGRFTGVVRFFDQRYPIRGQFSLDGYCELEIDRIGGPALSLRLSQGAGPGGVGIGGYLGNYEIIGDYALVFPTAAPEAGAYTFALPPNRDDLPQGNGFVTGRVSRRGAVSFVGRIGDGQAFSFGSQLRRGGSAQFYVVAGTEPRDRLSGRLQFPADAGTEASGNFVWFKAPQTEGFFQSGFTSELTIVGSRLEVSDADQPILDYTGETVGLDISFADGENNPLLDGLLAGLGENALEFQDPAPALALRAGNAATQRAAKMAMQRTFLSPPVRTVDFRVSRARGLFSGTFRNPAEGGRRRSFGGVFLQHQNSGAGLFVIGGRTGRVTIAPR